MGPVSKRTATCSTHGKGPEFTEQSWEVLGELEEQLPLLLAEPLCPGREYASKGLEGCKASLSSKVWHGGCNKKKGMWRPGQEAPALDVGCVECKEGLVITVLLWNYVGAGAVGAS